MNFFHVSMLLLRTVFFAAFLLNSTIAFGDFGELNGHLEIESLHRSDTNGQPVFASLNSGSSQRLRIYSSADTQSLFDLSLPEGFNFIDLEPIIQNRITTGVALLGVRRSNNGVRVWQWNWGSTELAESISFGSRIVPIDLEVVDDGAGPPIAAVLSHYKTSNRTRVLLKPFSSSGVSDFLDLGFGFIGQDMELAEQPDGGSQLVAVLGKIENTGGARVKVYSSETLSQVSSVPFGRVEGFDLLFFAKNDSDMPVLVVLRDKADVGKIKVDTRDLNGSRLSLLQHLTDTQPVRLVMTPSSETLDSSYGILAEHPDHQRSFIFLADGSGNEVIASIDFGSGAFASDVQFLESQNSLVSNVAVAQKSRVDELLQIKIRDIQDYRQLTIPIDPIERVPRWFSDNRIHGHTRLGLVHPTLGLTRTFHNTDESLNAAHYFDQLGALTFTRHVKSADEDPWWPTAVPLDGDGTSPYENERDNEGIVLSAGENPVQQYIDESWSRDKPVIAYYADSGEQRLAENFPNWICQTSSGDYATHPAKGYFLDITGPYGDIVQERLLELADMGASAVYLDLSHLPRSGCWGTQIAIDYEIQTGSPPPSYGAGQEYQLFIEFVAKKLTQAISEWKNAVTKEYPNFQFIISVTSIPALTRSDMNLDLVAIDSPKSELRSALAIGQNNRVFSNNPELYEPEDHIRISFGLSLLRDLAGDNLPHIWTPGMPNLDHIYAFISAVLSHGAIAALDVLEELLAPGESVAGFAKREELTDGFELGNQISSVLLDTKPIHWAGIYFSESARNEYEGDELSAWTKLLLPTVGAYDAFSQMAIPIKILTDKTIANNELDGLDIIYLPEPEMGGIEQMLVIEQFELDGGIVVRNAPSNMWDTAVDYDNRVNGLQDEVRSLLIQSPVLIDSLPQGVLLNSHQSKDAVDNPRIVLTVTNQFDFVQSVRLSSIIPPSEINPPPEPIPQGLEVFVSTELPAFSGKDPSLLTAINALDDEALEIEMVSGGVVITLPSFSNILVVEVK